MFLQFVALAHITCVCCT